MRAIGLVSVGLMMITLPVTDAAAASNRWCAVYNRRGGTSENCGYATLDQCRYQVLGLGGWCRPNPFPGTAFGTSRTWSAGPPPQRRGGDLATGPPAPQARRVLDAGPHGSNLASADRRRTFTCRSH